MSQPQRQPASGASVSQDGESPPDAPANVALRESEALYRQLANLLPVAVYTCDAAGVITYYNEQAARLWGRAPNVGDTDQRFCGSYQLFVNGKVLPHDQSPMALALREGISYREAQADIRRPDGTQITVRVNIDPIRNDQGQIVGAINAFHDVSAVKQAEENLQASHETFRQLVENSPFGVYVVDADFRLATVSAGAQEVFKSVRPLLGRDFAEVLRLVWSEPAASGFIDLFHHTMATGEPYRSPRTVERRADIDTTEAYDWKIERIAMPDGRYGIVCHFYDLSDRQRWEVALCQSEERARHQLAELDSIYSASPVGLVMFDLDFRYVRINDALAAMNGVPADEHIGKCPHDLVPDIAAATHAVFQEVVASRRPVRFELKGSTPGLIDRVWDEHWYPLIDPNGELFGVGAVAVDITAQKQAEEGLRAGESRLRATLESITDGFFSVDAQWRFVYINGEAERQCGMSRDEVIGKPWQEVFPEAVGSNLEYELRRCMSDRVPIEIENFFEPWQRWFWIKAYPTPEGGWAQYFRDVTQQKHDQWDRERRQRTLAELVERSPFGTYIVDSQFRIAMMSKSGQEGAFVNVRPLIGRPFGEAMHILWPAEVAEQIVNAFRNTLQTGAPFHSRDFIYPRADTDIVEGYEWELHQIALPDGTNGVICYYYDSTRLRETERALRQSEERLRLAADVTGFGTYDFDVRRQEVVWSPQLRAILQLPGEGPVSPGVIAEMVHPQDREDFNLTVGRALDPLGTGCHEIEVRVIRGDGVVRWIRDVGQAQFEGEAESRRVIRVVGTVQDITQRKEAEQALRESEDRYRAVVENQEEMLCRFRSDGTIVFVNSAYARSRGTTPDALTGADFWNFVAEEHRPAVREMLASMTPQNPQVRIENRFQAIEGWRWTLWTNRALAFDDEGHWTEAQSSGIDITDRKRAEETVHALLRISERLNSTLDVEALLDILVAEAISLVNAAGGVAGLNTPEGLACKRYMQNGRELELEYCWPPLHGLPGWVLVHKAPYLTNDAASDPQIVQELVARFKVRTAISTPIITAEGEVVGFFEIHNKKSSLGFTRSDQELLVSVSQVAAIAVQNALAYRTVRHAEEALREADRRKDEFLAVLAHELRNPLAPIRTGLQIIQLCDDDPATAADTIQVMDRQLQQLVRLIDDLLDISRITRGKIELRREQCDLATILSRAIEGSRPLIEEAGVELTVTFPRHDVQLHADPARLAQVFSNLLTNAAKYTDRGGHIWLTGEQHGSEVHVTVRDTGIGIRKEMLSRIFEMFTQVDKTERSYGGLGIGLSLVRALVDLHGGTVEARSDGPGHGSEFRVRLPHVALPGIVQRPAAGPLVESPSCRILVVDDNHDAARTLSLLLERMGHEVSTAHDGLEAISAAEAFGPEVVLLDLGMPNLNGFEAAQRIRQSSWGERILLVALTGWGQEADRQKTREAGFDAHLVKPVGTVELKKLLASLQADTGRELS